jgi:ABC-type Fe3+/spermidine/putrescine transport system ATPase subunit
MLAIDQVEKSYDQTPVLRGVSLRVAAGSVAALLGPSGCGKTTLLRIVAGLERADAGSVRFADERVDGLPPHRRGFGLMFQDYALFPHLDVAANVAFGLRERRLDRAAVAARVAAMLALVGMAGYGRRRVYELSGGERQRVALARSLAPGPRLLMLDEPLAALDRELRERLQEELHSILRHVGATALYVTHDQGEAMSLADQVVLMNAGRVEQDAPPTEIYRRPASLWAARFLGLRNVVAGVYRGDGLVETGLGPLRGIVLGARLGEPALVVVAPDAGEPAAAPGENVVAVALDELQFRGRYSRASLRHASGGTLELDLEQSAPLSASLDVRLSPERVLIYPGHGDAP